MVVFQPQIASWDGQKHAIGFAAVSYVAKGEQKPALGTIQAGDRHRSLGRETIG
jgi:hypothetical protein